MEFNNKVFTQPLYNCKGDIDNSQKIANIAEEVILKKVKEFESTPVELLQTYKFGDAVFRCLDRGEVKSQNDLYEVIQDKLLEVTLETGEVKQMVIFKDYLIMRTPSSNNLKVQFKPFDSGPYLLKQVNPQGSNTQYFMYEDTSNSHSVGVSLSTDSTDDQYFREKVVGDGGHQITNQLKNDFIIF